MLICQHPNFIKSQYLFDLFLNYLYPRHNTIDEEAHYANQTIYYAKQIKLTLTKLNH